MGARVKVLQKGKITIPAKVREALGVEEGDYLTMDFQNGKMIMIPSASVERPTAAISGLASGVAVKEPLDEEIKKASSARLERKRRRYMK